MGQEPDNLDPNIGLQEWLRKRHGKRTGTFTFNGVTYTDMNEVDWRIAHNEWLLPKGS